MHYPSCMRTALLALALTASCSEKIDRPPAGTDSMYGEQGGLSGGGGAESDAAGSDGGADGADTGGDTGAVGGDCNNIALTRSLVDGDAVVAALPTPAGGTVADGTFALQTYQVYVGSGGTPGPTGRSLAQTLVIGSGTIQSVTSTSLTDPGTRQTWSYSVQGTSGTQMAWIATCAPVGTSATQVYDFTATTSQLTLYNTTTGEALTFAHQ